MQPNNSLKIPANFLNTHVVSRPKLSPLQYFLLFFMRLFIQFKRMLGYSPVKAECVTIRTANDTYFDKEHIRFLRLFDDPERTKDTNKNMDKEFYDYKKYEDIMIIENNEIETKWRTRILIEHTPRGNIMMYYNSFKRGFAYYSDQQGVPYVILNTMAMKYVRVFGCRDLFMDDTVTPVGSPSPLIQIYKDEEKNAMKLKMEATPLENRIDPEKLKKGPFAKLKKYNVLVDTPKETITLTHSNGGATSSVSKSGLVECNINRFLYMGKLTNSSVLQRVSVKKIMMVKNSQYDYMFEGEHELQKEVLSYSDFKRKLRGTEESESHR